MKNICILGSTGSIGKNALEIIENSQDYSVVALSAHRNYKLLIQQIEKFCPKYVSIGTAEGYKEIKGAYPDLEVYVGNEGLRILGGLDETDIILTAVSGSVGIEATIEAVKKGKRVALANKETMVAAGDLINRLLGEHSAEIIPVDSEHSAIFQALLSGRIDEVSKLIITASGGTFRGKKNHELEKVSVEDALKHPNWSMGKKITIDSSTLVNKGLEVIEAHQLFGIPYDNIEVLIHPQSVVHSMVEFRDRSVIAQMGIPDMKIPIQYAFTYPRRESNSILEGLDLLKFSELTFEKLDGDVFKGVEYAFYAGREGKSMPLVYNAANEVAVELFLNKRINFLDIYRVIHEAMEGHSSVELFDLETIIQLDLEIRKRIMKKYT